MTTVFPTARISLPARRTLRLRLGARPSSLSLAQSRLVARSLEREIPDLAIDIVPITTTGDQITDRPLHDCGGKGLFTKQLELALLEGRVDFAVHSFKDVPVTMPLVDQSQLMIAAVPVRADARDVLVSAVASSIAQLPKNARVGTGSLRRKSQLLAVRPDLRIELIRGNIDTRLNKYTTRFDAIVLAAAGLKRAKLFDPSSMTPISANVVVPAAAQGALALQCRADAPEVRDMLATLNDPDTALAVAVERQVIRLLNGDCHSPIAAHATVKENQLHLRVAVARRDGTPPIVKATIKTSRAKAYSAPALIVRSLEEQGATQLLQSYPNVAAIPFDPACANESQG